MHEPTVTDDLQLPADPEQSWVAGQIEIPEERPTTSLARSPRHRKFVIGGVAACGLLGMIALLMIEPDAPEARAAIQPIEPAPVEVQSIEPAPVAVVEPEPAAKPKPRKAGKPVLAASSPAAVKPSAAPTPSPAPETKPAPASAPATKPAEPATKPAEPATKPSELPGDETPSVAPAGELPDVEPWDEADAALEEDDQPAENPSV